MILPLQSFTTLLQNMSAGLQGGAAQLVDLSIGSVLRALLEACASVALWMQWLILQVLSMTRAATSIGADLDSWMADFSFARLPGATSTGSITFARFTPGLPTTIPVGTIVRTTDGTVSFAVVSDTTNPAWTAAGYVISATAASVTVETQAIVAGAAGNVIAGAVGLLGTAIPGVDSIVNAFSFAGGVDPEADAALRIRFQLYINSRSLATLNAVGTAIQSLQQGLRYAVLENVDRSGSLLPGNFCVIVDDGSGTASSSLLSAVSSAVEAVRPLGSTYSVSEPTITAVDLEIALSLRAGAAVALIISEVQHAVAQWVTALPMGGKLALSKIEAIAHAVDDAVISVASATINGEMADVQVGSNAIIQASAVNVSVS